MKYAAGLAAITVCGCASADPLGAIAAVDCPDRPITNIVIWMDAPALQPGEAVSLTPYYTARPGMAETLPPACLAGATVSPQSGASVARLADGALSVRIAEDAAPGPVRIEARYADLGMVRARLDVYSAAQAPLTGYWAQDAEACAAAGAEPIRELVFEGDGEFTVTWTPFESYKDYWGRYAFDPQTGRLTLEPESGNHVPRDVRSGSVDYDPSGVLRLQTASFGAPRRGPACDAPFRRR